MLDMLKLANNYIEEIPRTQSDFHFWLIVEGFFFCFFFGGGENVENFRFDIYLAIT